jgi:hypothetical protein
MAEHGDASGLDGLALLAQPASLQCPGSAIASGLSDGPGRVSKSVYAAERR